MEPLGSRPHGAQLGDLGPSTGCFYPSQLVGVGVAPVLSSWVQGDEGAELGMRRRRRLLNPMTFIHSCSPCVHSVTVKVGRHSESTKGFAGAVPSPPGPHRDGSHHVRKSCPPPEFCLHSQAWGSRHVMSGRMAAKHPTARLGQSLFSLSMTDTWVVARFPLPKTMPQ